MVKISKKVKRKRLTPLETYCIRKFYLTACSEINKNATDFFKSLGIEKGLEVTLKLAIDEPVLMKVIAIDNDNFTILFDEDINGKFSPIFKMRNGIEE